MTDWFDERKGDEIMASQPANAAIEVFRTVRTYRQDLRHESLKVLFPSQRDMVMSVPAREVIAAQTHDGVVSDAWRFGHPVVTFPRNFVELDDVVANVTDTKLQRLIGGRDVFVTKTSGNNTDDLHAEVQALDNAVNTEDTVNPLVVH